MYLHPVKTEIYFRDRCEVNNDPEITDLLRYWPMLEIFDANAVEVDYL